MATFHVGTRLQLRGAILRARFQGKIPLRISASEIVDAASDELIDATAEECGLTARVGAFGDGSFIQAVTDWLKSDEGKQFIQKLLDAILAVLI